MAKARSKRYDIVVEDGHRIPGVKPRPDHATSIDVAIEPCAWVFERLETRCVRECCGEAAFALTAEEIGPKFGSEESRRAISALAELTRSVGALSAHTVRSDILGLVLAAETFLLWIDQIVSVLREGHGGDA